jgi:hypothetical protein
LSGGLNARSRSRLVSTQPTENNNLEGNLRA